MELRDNDTILIEKNNMGDVNMVLPYAQLGSVDFNKSCCCCYSVNFAQPGWGCNQALVEEISGELQQRKVKRGNIAQIKQLEAMQNTTRLLDCQVDVFCEKEGIAYPPSQQDINRLFGSVAPRVITMPPDNPHIEAAVKFDEKHYEITDYFASACQLLCCPCGGWATRQMDLDGEEMIITQTDCCSKSHERTPYAQLGSVETETSCCCCTELPEVAKPGCGCNQQLVDEIAGELQQRKVKRGNIAQLKMQENMLNEIMKTSVKMDLIFDKRGIVYSPSQEIMASVVGTNK